MTLDDPKFEFSGISQIWEATTVKRMKTRIASDSVVTNWM